MQKLKIPYLSFSILLFVFSIFMASVAFASETNGTIAGGGNNGYAWSDRTGWVNFGITNGGISITDAGITGYAWNSNYGWINMAPTNGGVTVAASGALSGHAWGEGLGWINFAGVTINSSGKFIGTASGAIVGTLTFDCANCSVTTDFRARNFRTVVPAPTTIASGGGATGGGGSAIASVPSQITSYNFLLTVYPYQSGHLEQTVSSNRKIIIDVPKNIHSKRFTISASEDPLVRGVNSALSPQNADLVNSAFYDITAKDENNNLIRSFSDYITITLPIPESLQTFSDVGVYWFDEGAGQWKWVSDASFSAGNSNVTFKVNHLTKFGIFRILYGLQEQISLPVTSQIVEGISEGKTLEEALSEILKSERESIISDVSKAIESFGVASLIAGEEISEEIVAEEAELPAAPEQLFDINVEIENTKITSIKNLVARVLFTSFGRVPTSVDLTFDILNESGEKIYSKTDEITVRTQEVLTERFTEIEEIFSVGKYTLLVTTVYNVDVVDEFRQDFEIAGEGVIKKPFWRSLWFWGISTIFLIIIFFIVVKKIKNDEENKGDNARITY